MPSKIRKFLQKLGDKRRLATEEIMACIEVGDFAGLNIKKLGGLKNEYRVRVGKIRIKFFMNTNGQSVITDVEFRSDTTYR